MKEIRKSTQYNEKDIIKVFELGKTYQSDHALKNITFGVKKTEILGIIGPTGAGKSTLINILSGISTQSSGYYELMGDKLQIGICPQFNLMWDQITTEEHLSIFGKIKGLKHGFLEYTIEYFLNKMQLDKFRSTRAGNLSGGNKRKLCVTIALIGGNNIVFFDEPSTGVDPMSRRFLLNTLKENVQMKETSAILTTHTMEEAEQLCDRVGILINGQFLKLGSVQELKKQYSQYFLSILIKLIWKWIHYQFDQCENKTK